MGALSAIPIEGERVREGSPFRAIAWPDGCWISPAPRAFRSPYRQTARRCASVRTGTALKRPWCRWAVLVV